MSCEGWVETKLGQVASIKGGKRLPKGINLQVSQNSHPYIRVRDLTGKKHVSLDKNIEYVDDITQKAIARYTVNSNDVIISIVGSIGLVSKIHKSLNKANLTENCAKIVDLKNLDSDFLYYFLSSDMGQIEVKRGTVGAVQAKLPLKNIQDIRLPLPPLHEQCAIARILSSLDDKIELNNRMNKTLEEIAQTLYKSWFVDFEPFGGTMPTDWYSCKIGDLSSEINTRLSVENDIKVLSAIKTGDLVPSDDYFTKQVYSKELTRYKVVEPNDFAYNPMRLNIGSIGMNECGNTCCVSPDYIVFRAQRDYHIYLRFFIKSSDFLKAINSFVSGSVRQRVYYKQLKLIETICPDINTISKFNQVNKVLESRMNEIERENEYLIEIRDTLLPKLMSGEIRVPLTEE